MYHRYILVGIVEWFLSIRPEEKINTRACLPVPVQANLGWIGWFRTTVCSYMGWYFLTIRLGAGGAFESISRVHQSVVSLT